MDATLDKILETLAPDHNLGVLLAAQMGGTPQEVQLLLQTTELDEARGALKVTGQYIIRAIGVREHRLSLGLFNTIVHTENNPLLEPHNGKIIQVYFRGTPENVDGLMIELNQLYGQVYGRYDPMRRMAEEINHARPLETLLKGGQGMLGEMPQSFAEKTAKLLERHGLQTSFIESETHRPDFKHSLLVMDDSYFIAQMFSAEPITNPHKPVGERSDD